MSTYVAVLAGGSGTRFWPASTRAVPKQMLPLIGTEPLLRTTVGRLDGVAPPERTLVITAERFADQVRELLPELPPDNVVTEPFARNTAAACALACHVAIRRDPDATVVTLPADHVIRPVGAWRDAVNAAAEHAADTGRLVTMGLEPTRAATGYGWIELGEEVARRGGHAVHAVTRFVEKPDLATTEAMLAGGGPCFFHFAWAQRNSTACPAPHAFALTMAVSVSAAAEGPADG